MEKYSVISVTNNRKMYTVFCTNDLQRAKKMAEAESLLSNVIVSSVYDNEIEDTAMESGKFIAYRKGF